MPKSILSIFLILISTVPLCAQINFEPGYYITNNGDKNKVLIKNKEWLDSPEEIEIKLNESSATVTLTLDELKEFSINNGVAYVKETVNLDLSSNKTSRLGDNANPNFVQKTVFLRKIIKGKASLFEFSGMEIKRYFFQVDDSPLKPLVYKRYLSRGKIATNSYYRQTLSNSLKCDGLSVSDFENIAYEAKSLNNLFLKYNECKNSQVVTYRQKSLSSQGENKIKLRAKIGVRSQNATYSFENESFEFPSQIGLQFGIEGEFILKINRNKWSILGSLTYFEYADKQQLTSTQEISIDYSGLELSTGGRHSMFITDDIRAFINASFMITIPTNQSFIKGNSSLDRFETLANLSLGTGVEYKNISLEIRLQTPRTLLVGRPLVKYKSVSATVGYAF